MGGKGGHGDQVIDKIRLRMKFSIVIIANEIESSERWMVVAKR